MYQHSATIIIRYADSFKETQFLNLDYDTYPNQLNKRRERKRKVPKIVLISKHIFYQINYVETHSQ